MNRKKTSFRKSCFCYLILLVYILSSGCKSGPKVEEFLIGSWRAYKMKVHSILTFHANGNWVIENRVEGKLSKIVAKRGRISGEWFYTDDIEGLLPEDYEPPEEVEEVEKKEEKKGEDSEEEEEKPKVFLVLTVLNAEEAEDWVEGSTNPYEIVVLDKEKLILKSLNGDIMDWDRVRAEKGKDLDADGSLAVKLGSLVVNLSRTKVRHKKRYLCIDLDMILEVPVQEGVPMPEPPPLHPRVREAAIFYLSSLTYKDIKSIDKSQMHINNLKDVLNPYMKGKIKELFIRNIIVTSEKKNVEDFKSQILKPQEVEAPPAEGESETTDLEKTAEG